MELNYFDYCEIFEKLEIRVLNKLIKSLKINENSTVKIKLDSKHYIIIHKSTKNKKNIQLSYFDNNGAYADKEVKNIKEGLKLFNIYKLESKIMEVI